MEEKALLQKITIEDIYSPLDLYANVIGIDNLFKLCEVAGGHRIYLPKPDALFKDLRKRLIIAEYKTGSYTIEALAKKYDISIKTVHTYIHS